MSLLTIKRGAALPPVIGAHVGNPFQSLTLLSGWRQGSVVQVPKSGTLSKVFLRVFTVTNSQSLRVSLQTVSGSDGLPTGTLYGGSAAGTLPAPTANTGYLVSLATPATAVAGDIIAVVGEFDSTPGDLTLSRREMLTASAFPYNVQFNPGFGVWGMANGWPVVGLEYSDGSHEPLDTFPYSACTVRTFNSGSTPDERALRFSLPFTTRTAGAWMRLGTASSNEADFEVVLYEGTTVRLTVAVDAAKLQALAVQQLHVPFPTPLELAANTEYFLAVKPTTVNNVEILDFDVLTAAVMDSVDGGQAFHHGERTNGGAWTKLTTRRPLMGLYLDAFHHVPTVAGGTGHPVNEMLAGMESFFLAAAPIATRIPNRLFRGMSEERAHAHESPTQEVPTPLLEFVEYELAGADRPGGERGHRLRGGRTKRIIARVDFRFYSRLPKDAAALFDLFHAALGGGRFQGTWLRTIDGAYWDDTSLADGRDDAIGMSELRCTLVVPLV